VLSLRNLVLTRPDTPVHELMAPETIRVRADIDRETAARLGFLCTATSVWTRNVRASITATVPGSREKELVT